MRRFIAVFVTALFIGAQVLLPALPASGKAAPAAGCGGKMACCAVQEHCATASACAAHDVAAPEPASAGGAPCVRAAGCGHALPGVVAPTLDPALFAPVTLTLAAPASGPRSESRQSPPASIPQEPLSPPPRG